MPSKKKEKPNLDDALENDDADAVRRCLRDGIDPNQPAGSSWQPLPLVRAARLNSDAVVRALVEGGADVNICDGDGEEKHTPLSAVCARGVVPRDEYRSPGTAETTARIRLLVELGADVNYTAENVDPPLIGALHGAGGPAVELLINEFRADPAVASYNGTTVLMHAALFDDIPFIDGLVRFGCPPNATNDNGISPLHIATVSDNPVAIRALLKHGADPLLEDRFGATAHDYAVLMELPALAKLLRKKNVPDATEKRLNAICMTAQKEFRAYLKDREARGFFHPKKLEYHDDNFLFIVAWFADHYFGLNGITNQHVFTNQWPQFLKLVPPFAAGHYATVSFEAMCQRGEILDFFYAKEPLIDIAIAAYQSLGLTEFATLTTETKSIYDRNVAAKMEKLRGKIRKEQTRGKVISAQWALDRLRDKKTNEILEQRLFDDVTGLLNRQIDSKIAEQPRRKAFQEYWRAKD